MREIVAALCRAGLCFTIIEYDGGFAASHEVLEARRVLAVDCDCNYVAQDRVSRSSSMIVVFQLDTSCWKRVEFSPMGCGSQLLSPPRSAHHVATRRSAYSSQLTWAG